MHTLLLNADATPVSFLPISSIMWQEAIKFVYVGAAESLHTYDDWYVHSPSTTILVPSVIILKKQIKVRRSWVARDTGGPQKHLVYLRDMYICQYCNVQFPRSNLTIDHVLPKFYGGRTNWSNVTTACEQCNCRRGHDVSIQPSIKPYRPTYSQLIKNMRRFFISIGHPAQNYYLGWDEEKLRIVDPRTGVNNYKHDMNDNFDFGINIKFDFAK